MNFYAHTRTSPPKDCWQKLKEMETRIAIFKGRNVRRTIHNKEWCFSVVDVCELLTDSPDAGAYWRKLKQRLKEEGSEVVTFCHGLKLIAANNFGSAVRLC